MTTALDPFPAPLAEQLHRAFIDVSGTALRQEDRRKGAEVEGLLVEIRRALGSRGKSSAATLVDAACGKAYVGLLALAELPEHPRLRLVGLERQARLAQAAHEAAVKLDVGERVDIRVGDVGDPTLWPERPDLVVALHACGPAFDLIASRASETKARGLLLVPCCTSAAVDAAQRGEARAAALGFPRHAEVRRRFLQAYVDAERTLALEAAGYEVEVVAFVAPTVTPHNLVWRARRVSEPVRMGRAAESLGRLRG